MRSFLQKRWESGMEGPTIEEMISNAFSDFAPYAGAEQQQLRLSRQHTDNSITNIIYEESGDWSVSVANPSVGTAAFTTTGKFIFDLHTRIPLRWGRSYFINNNNNKEENENNMVSNVPIVRGRRFMNSTKLPSHYSSGTIGVLEFLFSSTLERMGLGIRLGPLSLRATSAPSRQSNNNKISENSNNKTLTNVFQRTPVIIDGSWTAPVENFLPAFLANILPTSCCISAAFQHPLGNNNNYNNYNNNNNNNNNSTNMNSMDISHETAEGDTLAAICLYSKPQNSSRDTFRLLIVQTLIASHKSFHFNNNNNNNTNESTRSTLFMGNASWRELGTLFAANASIFDNIISFSASIMMHDGDMDYETASVIDITPVFANPTLIKVGINKIGRIGVGIATKIFDNLTITLGVHYIHQAETRFGLEIAM